VFGSVVPVAEGLQVRQAVVTALAKGLLVMAFQIVGGITFRASVTVADQGQLASLAILCTPQGLAARIRAERVDHALRLERRAALWVLARSLHFTILPASDCEHEGRLFLVLWLYSSGFPTR
jgi:hypothetical protein